MNPHRVYRITFIWVSWCLVVFGLAVSGRCNPGRVDRGDSIGGDAVLAESLVCQPMLGRPAATSITVNVVSLPDIDIHIEWGTSAEECAYSSGPFRVKPGDRAIDLEIEGLKPDTRYHYRIRGKSPENPRDSLRAEGTFHTQRAPGTPFVFDIMSDSHQHLHNNGDPTSTADLYINTLRNVAADRPDFLIDLGDLIDDVRSIRSREDAASRYLEKRTYLNEIVHSVPFFLVLGNHEGEQGWRERGERPVAEWCALSRKEIIPNPVPNGFYSGNDETASCCGLREDYYAWEWGDALFVVLDPFTYTVAEPLLKGARDGWDWTLGRNQYEWLHRTLTESTRKWKLVFIHHLTGGILWDVGPDEFYGRGGIEAAKFAVDGRPSFEWGGENERGEAVFEEKRPGWDYGPVHDVMVKAGVDVLFHGHDHAFVYQTLDGIVYQECPRPNDIRYASTLIRAGGYTHGQRQPNSGHLRVLVASDSLRVDYVRSVLPEDGPLSEGPRSLSNRDVTFSYTIHK